MTAEWIDGISYSVLVPVAIFLALAPFSPEPHLTEKIGMLINGTLKKPIDIFDLFLHASPIALLTIKLVKDYVIR